MYQIFGFLAPPLGYVVQFIYDLVNNYGWTLIIFTLLIRVVLFPLALRQQKSTARMGAYQPMIKEIQKKWANDRNRQNQEVQKFYQENNIKMNVGCLPMLVNLIVLFGVIAVIQAPLQYIVHMPEQQIANGVQIVEHYNPEMNITGNAYTQQSILIGEIKENPQYFLDGVEVTGDDGKTTLTTVDEEWVDAVNGFNFKFLGLDLSQAPNGFNANLIWPILSVVSMLGSQFIIMKFSGNAAAGGKATMWITTLVMGVVFAVFAFRIPIGFSLYYTASNVVMTVQQLIVKRIHDPKKIQEEMMAEIEARRKAKKERPKTAPIIVDDVGGGEARELTESEAVKLRLERARKLDAMKYGEGPSRSDEAEEPPAEKPGAAAERDAEEEPALAARDSGEAEAEVTTRQMPEPEKTDYKPGRRRRASQKKDPARDEGESFADRERQAENNSTMNVKEGLEDA